MWARIDNIKHGPRPSPISMKPSESFPRTFGAKQRHFPSSPASLTERDATDTDDNSDTNEVPKVMGKELALLKHAEELINARTLFRNPFPRVVVLNIWVVEVWEEAVEVLGYDEQSEESRARVRVPNLL
jgi:hypothetical protein